MTETRAPFNGKKKELFLIELPLREDQKQKMYDYACGETTMTSAIRAIGTPVTGGKRDYEATVAHYEAKLAERDARIADLENALQGMIDLNLSGVTCIALARKVLKGPEA